MILAPAHLLCLCFLKKTLPYVKGQPISRCNQDVSVRLLLYLANKGSEEMRGLNSAVRLSCGRLSLSPNPVGLISSACLQREGDLQRLIITQTTTPLQRCSLH